MEKEKLEKTERNEKMKSPAKDTKHRPSARAEGKRKPVPARRNDDYDSLSSEAVEDSESSSSRRGISSS
jgi:hypothetical protein